MPDDNLDLLAAMYDVAPRRTLPPGHPFLNRGKTVTVIIDGAKVDVPNMAYVAGLEKQIIDQGREIARLTSMVNSTNAFIRRLTTDVDGRISGIMGDLDRKIDGRF